MAMLISHGANPNQRTKKKIQIWHIVFDAGSTPISICNELEADGSRGEVQMKALQRLRSLLVVRSEEKIFGEELTAKTDVVKRNPGVYESGIDSTSMMGGVWLTNQAGKWRKDAKKSEIAASPSSIGWRKSNRNG